jgi:excisionase family DNA binding protein
MELRIELDDRTIEILARKIAEQIPTKPQKMVYTTSEVAKLLDTNEQKVSMWRREGLLKGIRKGNGWIFRHQEVEKFLVLCDGLEIGTPEKCQEVKRK